MKHTNIKVLLVGVAVFVLSAAALVVMLSGCNQSNPSPTLPSEQGSGNAADSADTQESTQTPTESMPPVTESRPPEEEYEP